jgi:hypothetical protein
MRGPRLDAMQERAVCLVICRIIGGDVQARRGCHAWWPPARPGVCFDVVNNPGLMVRVYCQFVTRRPKKGKAGNNYSI